MSLWLRIVIVLSVSCVLFGVARLCYADAGAISAEEKALAARLFAVPEPAQTAQLTLRAYSLKTKTAAGTPPAPGGAAVSRDLLARGWTLGRVVHVYNNGERVGVYTISDVMHKKHRRALDVWTASPATAKDIGAVVVTAKLF